MLSNPLWNLKLNNATFRTMFWCFLKVPEITSTMPKYNVCQMEFQGMYELFILSNAFMFFDKYKETYRYYIGPAESVLWFLFNSKASHSK
jgi:hypothetical protein